MLEPLAGERQPGERGTAVQACNDWLRLGPGRTLPQLHANYIAESYQESPPTLSLGTLKQWSARYDWLKRGELYDAQQEIAKNERRAEILSTGLALEHERVEELKQLGAFLLDEIRYVDDDKAHSKVWVPDVKQIGGGEYAERVDIVRFNAALIDQLRGVLDDLAKETGGRKTRMDVRVGDLDAAIERELERLAPAGEGAASGTAGGDADAGAPE